LDDKNLNEPPVPPTPKNPTETPVPLAEPMLDVEMPPCTTPGSFVRKLAELEKTMVQDPEISQGNNKEKGKRGKKASGKEVKEKENKEKEKKRKKKEEEVDGGRKTRLLTSRENQLCLDMAMRGLADSFNFCQKLYYDERFNPILRRMDPEDMKDLFQ
jgi:hypothetical protein